LRRHEILFFGTIHKHLDATLARLSARERRAVIQDCDIPTTFHVSTGRDPRAARNDGGAVINYVSHSLSPTIEPRRQRLRIGRAGTFPEDSLRCR
jgi:hypothetical protein